jgi:uncharacterized protein (TIGR02118 family)
MGRLKLFAMGVRRAGMSRDDFHDYWRHPHGTWGRRMSTLRGYVQSHQIDTDLLGPEQSRYECVAEMWLDNLEDIEGFQREPVFATYLENDAVNFVEPDRAIYFAAEEEVLTSGPSSAMTPAPADDFWTLESRPSSVKLLMFAGPDDKATWKSEKDGSIGRSVRALRHVRCHAIALPRAPQPQFVGVQELWWPTALAFRQGVRAAPQAFAELLGRARESVTLLAQAERFL